MFLISGIVIIINNLGEIFAILYVDDVAVAVAGILL